VRPDHVEFCRILILSFYALKDLIAYNTPWEISGHRNEQKVLRDNWDIE
jgi:hypothetical protein